MKKLLFVIPTMRMGGAEKALVSLLKSLDPGQVEIDLFLFEQGGILQEQIPSWVRILPEDLVTRAMTLEFRLYWKDLLRQWKLGAASARLWMKMQPSIRKRLHLKAKANWCIAKRYIRHLEPEYDVAIGFLEGTADFYVIEKVTAKKKIGWIHSDFTGRRLLESERFLYKKYDYLATISEICRQAFISVLPEVGARISVIQNITCANDVRAASAAPMDEVWDRSIPHLLTVGRLEHQKGIDIAAKVSLILNARGLRHKWHVFGAGSMESQIETFIHENHLENTFSLDGQKKNPYPFMRRADIIVQPSRLEGKSMVLDEAKILGKAIVTTNYPSVADQIIDGETGVVTEMTPESVADGIERVLTDAVLRKQLEINCISSINDSEQALQAFYRLIAQ